MRKLGGLTGRAAWVAVNNAFDTSDERDLAKYTGIPVNTLRSWRDDRERPLRTPSLRALKRIFTLKAASDPDRFGGFLSRVKTALAAAPHMSGREAAHLADIMTALDEIRAVVLDIQKRMREP